jgi:lipopolysaccharide/colanic/teichoic acid biosynthesis glycosyltransferase
VKRFFDLIAAFAGMIAFVPVYMGLAIVIAMTSGLPVLFRQTRVGRLGRDFILLKFRTMTVLKGTGNGCFEPGVTRRVTAIGRFLRVTKLDELPQLWNVFKGDMSLVGPRPEVRKWVQEYPERWAFIHQVRPGITDPASIEFRNEEKLLAQSDDPERMYREVILPRKLGLYEEYVRSRTFWGDIVIILKTLRAVVAPQRRDTKL